MDKFWIILAIVIIALVGLFIVIKPNSSNAPSQEEAQTILEDDHIKWNKDASVTLIEYGDFQCPGCGGYYPVLKQLEAKHGADVRFVFRHFPLRTIHPNAQSAALAAEAAGKQGKFWEMHNKLFETQQAWGQISTNQQKLFEGYAEELGLDMDQFRNDYAAAETAQRINQDLESGKSFGVTSTPSFILNGQLIETPATLEAFSELLDQAVKEAQQAVPEGNSQTSTE